MVQKLIVKISEFTKLFLKNALDYRVLFVFTLLIPLVHLLWNNYYLFKHSFSDEFFYNLLFSYWGFIIIIHAMIGINLSLLALKENGFLKMFKYIAGSKYIIIVTNFLAQVISLLLTLTIFTVISCLLFKPTLLFQASIIMFFSFLITIIPISMFFLWIPALNVRMSTIAPFTSLLAIILSFISSISINNGLLYYLLLFNPVKLYILSTNWIADFFLYRSIEVNQLLQFLGISFLYIVVGIFFATKISVNSSLTRF